MGYQVVFIAKRPSVSPNRPRSIEPFFRTAGFPSLGNPVLDSPENGNPIDPISLGEGWPKSITDCGVMSLNCGSGRIRVQFVIGCGQRTGSNETTSNDPIMYRMWWPEFRQLGGLPGVRRSIPLSQCRPRQYWGDRSQSLHHEDVSLGVEWTYTETSLGPLVMVDVLLWIDLSRGPACLASHSSAHLLGDLYVMQFKSRIDLGYRCETARNASKTSARNGGAHGPKACDSSSGCGSRAEGSGSNSRTRAPVDVTTSYFIQKIPS
jgi:hypothetical protein